MKENSKEIINTLVEYYPYLKGKILSVESFGDGVIIQFDKSSVIYRVIDDKVLYYPAKLDDDPTGKNRGFIESIIREVKLIKLLK